MPRLSIIRYRTPDIQGEDSWLEFIIPTGIEATKFRKQIENVKFEALSAIPTDKKLTEEEKTKLLVDKYKEMAEKDLDDMTRILLTVISEHFYDWNWYINEPGDMKSLKGMTPEEIMESLTDVELEEVGLIATDLISVTKSNNYSEKKEMSRKK